MPQLPNLTGGAGGAAGPATNNSIITIGAPLINSVGSLLTSLTGDASNGGLGANFQTYSQNLLGAANGLVTPIMLTSNTIQARQNVTPAPNPLSSNGFLIMLAIGGVLYYVYSRKHHA